MRWGWAGAWVCVSGVGGWGGRGVILKAVLMAKGQSLEMWEQPGFLPQWVRGGG